MRSYYSSPMAGFASSRLAVRALLLHGCDIARGSSQRGLLHTGLMQGEASLRLGGCGSGLCLALLPVEEAFVRLLRARRACSGLGAVGKLMPHWLVPVCSTTNCMAGRRRHGVRVQLQQPP